MPPEITRLADAFLHNPVRVEVSRAATTAENITQTLVPSGGTPEEKRSTLRRIIRGAENFKNALIFCNRKRDVQVVYRSLQKHGFSVAGAARRSRPAHAHGGARRVPRRRSPAPRVLRRRRARPRHPRRQSRDQLRRAPSLRGLRPSHRAHRPRRQVGPGADPRLAHRSEGGGRDREAHRAQDRLAGRRSTAPRRGGRGAQSRAEPRPGRRP